MRRLIGAVLYGFRLKWSRETPSVWVLPECLEGVVADGHAGGEI